MDFVLDVICGGKIDEMVHFDLENTNSDERQQQFWEVGFSMNLKGLEGLENIPKMAAMMSVDMATL